MPTDVKHDMILLLQYVTKFQHFLTNFCFLFAVFKVDKWIKKERAKYNRVMTSKSGQPNKEVPPAELATLQRWDFYKDHLLEGQNVVSCDVSTCTNFFWVCLSLYLYVIPSMIFW